MILHHVTCHHARPCRAWARRLALALLMTLTATVSAAPSSVWISSWMASPQPVWQEDFAFPTKIPAVLHEQTIRQVVQLSLGGARIRIVLSNEYGNKPVRIGGAHIALSAGQSAIVGGTGRTVTFNGKDSALIPPGAPLISDPIDLPVDSLSSVAVSVFLPDETPANTFHWDGRQTAYLVPGDQIAAPCLQGGTTTDARIFLSSIQVQAHSGAKAILVMGDSITDGNGATVDANTRWPDFLAKRLAPRNVAVLNAGISGARLLGDRMGVNALARLDRDVLSQPQAETMIVLLGINDISWPGTAFDPQGVIPSADALIAAYGQLIMRAHAKGIRVVGATLTPFEGALSGTPLSNYYQPEKEALRQHINAWIRSSGAFDAVLDFDSLLADPLHPKRLKQEFDSGDHLHPGDRGNQAMAEAIDLDLLL